MSALVVLAHSPLVGPESWAAVAPLVVAGGYGTALPDLSGTVTGPPPYASRQADLIAGSAAAAPGPVILVGHSGAGPLLAAAGEAFAGAARPAGYVFVDAGLPTPGRSWLETVPADLAAEVRAMADDEGWLPPWSKWWGPEALADLLPERRMRDAFAVSCPRLPLAMFEEAHPALPATWRDVPSAYLRLSEAYDDAAAEAASFGWPLVSLDSHHLAPLTDPGPVAAALLELFDRLV